MSSSGKTLINISNKYDRVVALIDMDCFYCQVEEKLNPDLKGKPMAVVQYNTWQGGGIIAVNYAARAAGVTRHMRGDQAKEQCPEIELVHVPSVREKADLTKYREAGKDVANVLQTFTTILERASVDEAYLDITKDVIERTTAIDKGTYSIKPDQLINTYAAGCHNFNYFINEMACKYGNSCQDYDLEDIEHDDNDINSIRTSSLRLLVGATIVQEIRAKVKEITGFECSAGIAHNKILAKFACGLNKPNKQTLFPLKNVVHIFRTLQLRKITSLGGKFGADVCEKLKVTYIGEVKKFPEKELKKKFDEKNGSWLYLICRGIDLEPVTPRFCSKSIGCCKKFPGRGAIVGLNTLKHWLNELASEICDRLEKDVLENNRKARQMVVNYVQEINSKEISTSRSANLINYNSIEIANLALEVIKRNTKKFLKDDSESMIQYPVKFLGLSVGKFESNLAPKSNIKTMFEKQISKGPLTNNVNSNVNILPFTETLPNSSGLNNNDKSQINKNTESQNYSSFANQTDKAKSNERSTIEIAPEQEQKDQMKGLEAIEKNLFTYPDDLAAGSKECKIFDSESYDKKNDLLPELINEVEYDDLTSSTRKEEFISDKNQNAVKEIVSSPNSKACIEDLNRPGISVSQSYLTKYAEFQTPKLIEDFILCSQCNQKVLVYELQTHTDRHLAFQLSQQQRVENRKEVQKKLISTPPNKKFKPNNDVKLLNAKHKSQINISQYLLKFNEKPKENQIKCSECGCYIMKDKALEHKDFHMAQKVQREWICQNSLNKSSEQSSIKKHSTIFSSAK